MSRPTPGEGKKGDAAALPFLLRVKRRLANSIEEGSIMRTMLARSALPAFLMLLMGCSPSAGPGGDGGRPEPKGDPGLDVPELAPGEKPAPPLKLEVPSAPTSKLRGQDL